jgi:hypothetical protein
LQIRQGIFLQTVWYRKQQADWTSPLVMGLIQVGNNFRKFAVSRWARGYASDAVLDRDCLMAATMHADQFALWLILRHYLDRERAIFHGGWAATTGLAAKRAYPDAVLGARRNWMVESSKCFRIGVALETCIALLQPKKSGFI